MYMCIYIHIDISFICTYIYNTYIRIRIYMYVRMQIDTL